MSEVIRVMQVGMTENRGGLESYIMNLYRNIDRNKIQFDFFTLKGQKIAYQEEIESMGGRIYDIGYKKREILNHYLRFPVTFFKKHPEIKIIHFHKTSLIDIDYVLLSHFSQVPIRIIHSHSSSNMFKSGRLIKTIESWNVKNIDKFVTNKLACSKVAGEWLFPGSDYKIVKNTIDTSKFKFNHLNRIEIREKYHIPLDAYVIGHIGYFTDVKNHSFIIDIFIKLIQSGENFYLVLIGDGQLKEEILEKVKRHGLSDKVIFTGSVDSVYKYLSAMDLFILPSKFEGFPISAVEAQCSGLPTLLSDSITNEVKILENCSFLPINSSDKWKEKIMEEKKIKNEIFNESDYELLRKKASLSVKENGYDIEVEAMNMENFYAESLLNKGNVL
ncbi:glycosyltransferase [Vagococcus fluvialis]|uniref:glycosyltransferase n=1 Tax=Vagococcus fluvialis TaxID=2738 RepID=UPI001A8CFA51|nr:glycosyltransferase [Vagococcus fluvialis]MBO0479512.1 glycosyltransferase [Vagococcus fluvialis]MBO0484850.1 glycosyltransferase [Vagococcus fluvialis]